MDDSLGTSRWRLLMASTRSELSRPESDLREEGLPPDEAFVVLGNATRLATLLTLEAADDPLAYTELKREVGAYDSGRFNYHLDKLLGHFTDCAEGGYRLRAAGTRAAETVLDGTFGRQDPAIPSSSRVLMLPYRQ